MREIFLQEHIPSTTGGLLIKMLSMMMSTSKEYRSSTSPEMMGAGSWEHLHQRSVCDPALKILEEVHHSNPANPLEDSCKPENVHTAFRERLWRASRGALEQANKHSQMVFIDCSLFLIWLDSLIGPCCWLLLVVSHLFAVSLSVLWVGLEKCLVMKTWTQLTSKSIDSSSSKHTALQP
jgi:hypothetical protein